MFLNKFKIIAFTLLVAIAGYTISCVDALDTEPIDDSVLTSVQAFETPDDFKRVLAKLYAGLATTGQEGPAGNPDIQGIDEGFSSYLRQYWVHQVITTEEAVVGWNDPGLPQFNYHAWTASNDFVMGMYSRIFYQITLTNEFIREAQERSESVIRDYEAEARFLRALSYWHALDLYGGNVPFVTEQDPIGAFLPEQTNGSELFNYIESELLEILDLLPEPRSNQYGRADRAAAWTLLTKLYLNAEVYTGEDRSADAVTYAERVIDQGGFSLETNYQKLFMTDNDETDEVIFPIRFDGDNIRTFGGTTFIIQAQIGGDMPRTEFGVPGGGWAGHRATPQFVEKFDHENDGRALFFTEGHTLEIESLSEFTNGFAITKWRNVSSDGTPGKNSEFVDTDFPMFRLADVYLMYAEAVLRSGTGDQSKAVQLVNELRQRAFGDNSGNISQNELTLGFILDERARELYWEGHRRTDLIRFGQFTGSDYVWAWKGNNTEGSGTNDIYRIFPIPSSDINANPNLIQNPGY